MLEGRCIINQNEKPKIFEYFYMNFKLILANNSMDSFNFYLYFNNNTEKHGENQQSIEKQKATHSKVVILWYLGENKEQQSKQIPYQKSK
jgi:hypothetical protein